MAAVTLTLDSTLDKFETYLLSSVKNLSLFHEKMYFCHSQKEKKLDFPSADLKYFKGFYQCGADKQLKFFARCEFCKYLQTGM